MRPAVVSAVKSGAVSPSLSAVDPAIDRVLLLGGLTNARILVRPGDPCQVLGARRQEALDAVMVGDAVPGAGDVVLLAAKHAPVAVGPLQLPRREVVDDLALLRVDGAVREHDEAVVAPRRGEALEPGEQAHPLGARHVMDGATRVDETEGTVAGHVCHVPLDPPHLDAPLLREPLRLAEAGHGDLHPGHGEPRGREEHAVPSLAAAEVEYRLSRGQERDDLSGEWRRLRPPDVLSRCPHILASPRAPGHGPSRGRLIAPNPHVSVGYPSGDWSGPGRRPSGAAPSGGSTAATVCPPLAAVKSSSTRVLGEPFFNRGGGTSAAARWYNTVRVGHLVTGLRGGGAFRQQDLRLAEGQGARGGAHQLPGEPGRREAEREGARLHRARPAGRERGRDGPRLRRLGPAHRLFRGPRGAAHRPRGGAAQLGDAGGARIRPGAARRARALRVAGGSRRRRGRALSNAA